MSTNWPGGQVILFRDTKPETFYLIQKEFLYFRWYRLDLHLWMTGTDKYPNIYLIPENINLV